MRVTSTGTPIPKRDIEAKARGSGPVITYRLSPEELERVRRGERLETRKEEQNVVTRTEAPKAPDKMEVLRRLAAGKPVSKIETEMGLGKGVLHYWIDKWGLKGVKGEQAQRMLDEMQIDKVSGHVPVEPKPLKSSELVQEQVKDELIDRLKKELAEKTARINELEEVNVRAVALVKYWMGQVEGLGHEADRLREERDALLQTVERAVDAEVRPDHDPVNHPAHYTAGKVECIDAIESATVGLSGGLAYATGAAIKYLWRWSRKGGVEDLRKARWYLDRLIQLAAEKDGTA